MSLPNNPDATRWNRGGARRRLEALSNSAQAVLASGSSTTNPSTYVSTLWAETITSLQPEDEVDNMGYVIFRYED